MPLAAPRQCTQPGCRELAYNNGRCDKHPRERTNWGKWQAERGTSTDRGYGVKWRKIRKRILKRDNYLCQPCKRSGATTHANIVDHIKAKAKGGTDADDNLEAICKTCHDAKTAKEHM